MVAAVENAHGSIKPTLTYAENVTVSAGSKCDKVFLVLSGRVQRTAEIVTTSKVKSGEHDGTLSSRRGSKSDSLSPNRHTKNYVRYEKHYVDDN